MVRQVIEPIQSEWEKRGKEEGERREEKREEEGREKRRKEREGGGGGRRVGMSIPIVGTMRPRFERHLVILDDKKPFWMSKISSVCQNKGREKGKRRRETE